MAKMNHTVDLSDFEGSQSIMLASSSIGGKQLYAEVHLPAGNLDYHVNIIGSDHQTFGDLTEAIEFYNSISKSKGG